MFHGEVQMFHAGAKYFTERVKCSTEVLNIPRTMPKFHASAKYSTDVVKCSTEVLHIPRGGSNVPRTCQIFHGQ